MVPAARPEFFLEYLAFVFLPGLALLQLVGYHRSGDNLSFGEGLGAAFGLSLCVDTAACFAQVLFAPLELLTVHLIVLGSASVLAVALLRRGRDGIAAPKRQDAVLLALLAALGVIIGLYLMKYPVFPPEISADFHAHLNNIGSLVSTRSDVASQLLYYGVYYQLGAAFLLVGGNSLAAARDAMSILVVLSILLVYLAASQLTGSRKAALAGALLYVVPGAAWYSGVFGTGLYPNFFGLMTILFFLYSLSGVVVGKGPRFAWIQLALAVFAMYLSHYSVLMMVPAAPVVLLSCLRRPLKVDRRQLARSGAAVFVVVSPILAYIATHANLEGTLLAFMQQPGGAIGGGTYLSGLLQGVPVLSDLAIQTNNDAAFLVILVLASLGVYRCIRTRNATCAVAAFWLAEALLAAPYSVGAWRYSYVALVPLLILASNGVLHLLPPDVSRRQRYRLKRYMGRGEASRWVMALGLLALVAFTAGPSSFMLADSLSNSPQTAQAQYAVYDAMYWVKDNANATSTTTMMSVSSWWWLYSVDLVGVQSFYSFQPSPFMGLQAAQARGSKLLVVTNPATQVLPANESSFYPWSTYDLGSLPAGTMLVYNATDVRIYALPSARG